MAVGYGSNAVILASADRVLINTRIIQLASRVLVFSGASATFNEEFFINGTLGSGTVVSNMASGSHIGVFKIIGYRNN